MAFGKKDRFRVIYRPAGRKVFGSIIPVKTNKIGYLLTVRVQYPQALPLVELKGYPAPGWNDADAFHD